MPFSRFERCQPPYPCGLASIRLRFRRPYRHGASRAVCKGRVREVPARSTRGSISRDRYLNSRTRSAAIACSPDGFSSFSSTPSNGSAICMRLPCTNSLTN